MRHSRPAIGNRDVKNIQADPAGHANPNPPGAGGDFEPLYAAVERGTVRLAALARNGYPGRPLPPAMLPGLSAAGFWDAAGAQTWGLERRWNDGLELAYVDRGKTPFLVGNERFMLTSGQLAITLPWQTYRVGDPNAGSSRFCWVTLDVGARQPGQPWRWPGWLILSAAELRLLATLLSRGMSGVWPAPPSVGACFERLAQLVGAANPLVVQTRLQLCINELLITLFELPVEAEMDSNPHLPASREVESFLARLPQHLEEKWTSAEMAARCGLGCSAFATYCRNLTNLTPVEYLTHCRVEAAKKMLAERSRLNITEVALACGFQSSQYFATVFSRKTGWSPNAFRKAARRA